MKGRAVKDKLHGFHLMRLAGLEFPTHPSEREEGEEPPTSGFGEP